MVEGKVLFEERCWLSKAYGNMDDRLDDVTYVGLNVEIQMGIYCSHK